MSLRRKAINKKLLLRLCACAVVTGLLLHLVVSHTSWFKFGTAIDTGPVVWNVNASLWDPNELQHIIFVKAHKAASSTLFSILVRFSIARGLNVMFPRHSHLLSENSPRLNPLMPHPPSPPFLFDILCNHVVFDEDKLSRYFPVDTVYFTILREPLSQVRSAYDYYRNTHYNVTYLMPAPSFTQFLSDVTWYEPSNPYESFTNNRMSLDLGLPPQQIRNSSYVATFVQVVQKVFDLVLIAERFDESMVLMKRRLKWTTKDIIYTRLNQRKKRISDELDPSLYKSFRQFAQFDVALYDHFSQIFDQLVSTAGSDFQDEVESFKGILQIVENFCELSIKSPGQLIIPERKWNKQFEFDSSECNIIQLEDLVLDKRAKYWQLKRLKL